MQTRRRLGIFKGGERTRADSCRSADVKVGGKRGVEERQWVLWGTRNLQAANSLTPKHIHDPPRLHLRPVTMTRIDFNQLPSLMPCCQ